ncbi:MAG: FIST C-terminal domain-containing protein [Acidimicrobiia bacterium]|nr:FIST C-terminal domain-containing protein [Acidimicrobiia bacterium]
MRSYASALSRHPVAAQAVGETAGEILEQLRDEPPDLVVAFASTHHRGAFEDMARALHDILQPGVLVGATADTVVGDGREVEEEPALSLLAARLPDVPLVPVCLQVAETPDGPAVVGWPEEGVGLSSLLLLADPSSFPVDAVLTRVNDVLPGLTVIGGLTSAAAVRGSVRLTLDGEVVTGGAVGVFLGLDVRPVVSQGCRPIGQPFVVTRAEGTLLQELGGRRAVDRLQELVGEASEAERALMRGGLQLGIVVDEQRPEYGRGDFLVRSVVGADQEQGALAVAETVDVGRTVQFHVRDAAAADEDLRASLAGEEAGAALLFTCNGRGRHLFDGPDHDADLVTRLLGRIPVAGCSCAGEIGPVAGRNLLHGFTASLALFPR